MALLHEKKQPGIDAWKGIGILKCGNLYFVPMESIRSRGHFAAFQSMLAKHRIALSKVAGQVSMVSEILTRRSPHMRVQYGPNMLGAVESWDEIDTPWPKVLHWSHANGHNLLQGGPGSGTGDWPSIVAILADLLESMPDAILGSTATDVSDPGAESGDEAASLEGESVATDGTKRAASQRRKRNELGNQEKLVIQDDQILKLILERHFDDNWEVITDEPFKLKELSAALKAKLKGRKLDNVGSSELTVKRTVNRLFGIPVVDKSTNRGWNEYIRHCGDIRMLKARLKLRANVTVDTLQMAHDATTNRRRIDCDACKDPATKEIDGRPLCQACFDELSP